MQIKTKIFTIGIILFLVLGFSFANAQKISVDKLKERIQKRIEQRNRLIKDYQCDIVTKRVSNTPRGEMKMESNYRLYFKSPDKRKVEFLGGKRGEKQISAKDINRPGKGSSRGKMRRFTNKPIYFEIGKYIDGLKILGTEKVKGVDTYKISIKVSDRNDRFKSFTVWIDQKSFDVVKFKGKLRKNDRLYSGNVIQIFAPIGPKNIWMPVREKSERYLIFQTPRGEMDIESKGTTKFENYKFNVGLKDDFFDSKS